MRPDRCASRQVWRETISQDSQQRVDHVTHVVAVGFQSAHLTILLNFPGVFGATGTYAPGVFGAIGTYLPGVFGAIRTYAPGLRGSKPRLLIVFDLLVGLIASRLA